MELKRQQYLDKLISKKDNGRVKIITGIRRCGKSYLLFKLYKDYLLTSGITYDQIIEISLDDVNNIEYRNPFKLNDFIKSKITDNKKYYVFIDEVQFSTAVKNPYINEDDAEKITFIDILLSLMKKPNVDVYVTGSNSKMLSKDILTQFRDRGDNIRVYPLSFKEVSVSYSDLDKAWQDFKIFGGMPYVQNIESIEEKTLYLKDLFDETYIKDILDRENINNKTEILNILLDFISSSIGSLSNPFKIANRFNSEMKINIKSETIAKYLDFFEDAYIIKSSKRFSIKGAKYFTTPLKYYFTDIGLRNARLNMRQIEDTHIMENIIFNDLIRRGFSVGVGTIEDKYYKENKWIRSSYEVDFVINRGNVRYYIQSAYALPTQEKIDQERKSLLKIEDSFKKIIVVKDSIVPHYDEYGIYYIGLFDFLLQDELL